MDFYEFKRIEQLPN